MTDLELDAVDSRQAAMLRELADLHARADGLALEIMKARAALDLMLIEREAG